MVGLETENVLETQNKDSSVQHKKKLFPENKLHGPTQQTALYYSGPIPPPEHLTMYEKIVPGIAKQFLEEPHREAEHRRSLESKMVDAQIKLAKKGQNIASILAFSCTFASFFTIYRGYSIEGLGALLLSIGLFIGVFIYGKNHKSGRS